MTEEVQTNQVESQEPTFLGLNRNQFATVLTLTSVANRLPLMLQRDEVDTIMEEMLSNGEYLNLKDALFWTCDQRNRLMNLQTTITFALNLVAQVQDHLVEGAFAPTEETK